MNIPEPVIEEWRENVSYCIGKMDERGCSNPENNSQMLWNIEWEELRNELFILLKALNYYSRRGDE